MTIRNVLNLLLILFPNLLLAELPYSLIILENKSIADFAIPKECFKKPGDSYKSLSAIIYTGVDAKSSHTFQDGKKELASLDASKKSIPIIYGSIKETYSTLGILSNKKMLCEISITTPTDEVLKQLLEQDSILSKSIISSGDGWFYLDLKNTFNENNLNSTALGEGQIIPQNNAVIQSSNPHSGTIEYISSQGFITYPKFSVNCIRPYIPGTGWGSGQAHWIDGRPRREGYSVKDENTSSNFTNSLICPKSVGQINYAVDGVYKLIWGYYPIKVPDHCTFAHEIENGQVLDSCCCTAAIRALRGGCSRIDATTLGDWPDWGKSCS
jgi:hypothetical protein